MTVLVSTQLPAIPQMASSASWSSAAGTMLGLLVSALVDTPDKATAIVPILLIPQVILADVVAPLGVGMRQLAELCIVAFWSADAMVNTLPTTFPSSAHGSLGMDVGVLVLFTALFACASVWALKRKEAL